MHRYVPVGLLERPAAVLNWRTPAYVGRNDLETLFASDHPADWVLLTTAVQTPTTLT